jgi:cytochrome P450
MTSVQDRNNRTDFVPSFDPLIPHPEYVRDPYKVYAELRENAPMYRSPHGILIASRHEEILRMLKDPRFGRGYFYFENMAERLGPAILKQPIYDSARNMMLMKDGEDHTRLRGLFEKAFSPKSIEKMRAFTRGIMDELIDAALAKTSFDIMLDLAFPLPSAVICHLLGVPREDWHKFSQRSATGSRALEPAPLNPLELAQQNRSVNEFREYFQWLIELKKQEPGDDLTSLLLEDGEREGRLTRPETLDNLRMMFIGGQETAVNTIGNGLLALYRHPEQLQKLKNQPELLPNAITEMIRYDSSVQMTPRQAREDVTISGVTIQARETVICIVASGNRDPEAWDRADEFDITRTANHPLSFGGGPHYCIGAGLAKMEAEVAFQAIFERVPNLRSDISDPRWLTGTVVFRGLKTLPATV